MGYISKNPKTLLSRIGSFTEDLKRTLGTCNAPGPSLWTSIIIVERGRKWIWLLWPLLTPSLPQQALPASLGSLWTISLSPLLLAPSPWLTDVLTSLPSWRQRLCSLTLSPFEMPSCPYLPIPSNFCEKAPCSRVCPHPTAGDLLSRPYWKCSLQSHSITSPSDLPKFPAKGSKLPTPPASCRPSLPSPLESFSAPTTPLPYHTKHVLLPLQDSDPSTFILDPWTWAPPPRTSALSPSQTPLSQCLGTVLLPHSWLWKQGPHWTPPGTASSSASWPSASPVESPLPAVCVPGLPGPPGLKPPCTPSPKDSPPRSPPPRPSVALGQGPPHLCVRLLLPVTLLSPAAPPG